MNLSLSYVETVQAIESLGIMPVGVPSLEPMREGLRRLFPGASLLEVAERTVVIAGTNGKGSVCASLESLILAAGESVGLYTSPHLVETTERIRLGGRDVSQENFCLAYRDVRKRIADLKVTHFEILTLMAAWLFFSGELVPKVNWAVFEVGLGGTWDATNAIPHQFCGITALGYDHQSYLGNSLREIATNKFGIIQTGSVVVHAPFSDELKDLAKQIEKSTNSRWMESEPYTVQVEAKSNPPRFKLITKWGETYLALPGNRAGQNSTVALTLFEALGFSAQKYLSALAQVRWPGRMELVDQSRFSCPVYLSGDHNPTGAESLLEILPYYSRRKLYILVGIGIDKDFEKILSILFSISDAQVFLTETPFRGRPLKDYGNWLTRAHGAYSDPAIALSKIAALAEKEDLVLITGSLYLVGLARSLMVRTSSDSN